MTGVASEGFTKALLSEDYDEAAAVLGKFMKDAQKAWLADFTKENGHLPHGIGSSGNEAKIKAIAESVFGKLEP
jgi:hypothetical protein